jgi:hypothetical protein
MVPLRVDGDAEAINERRIELLLSELSERYAATFEGMKMDAGGGQTTITGQIVDQSYLYGTLSRINALGLELVSVESSYPEYKNTEQKDSTRGGGSATPHRSRPTT